MKKNFTYLLLSLLSCLSMGAATPAISFRTNIYAEHGDSNAFTLVVGGSQTGTIRVDCGNGIEEYELEQSYFDPTIQAMRGTIVSCNVSEAGIVKIYCDEGAQIDYFNGLGCFIRNIEFANPEALTVLNLEHNELEQLDLSGMTNLQALYLSDNPFNKRAFDIAIDMPYLQILEIGIIENINPNFNFRHFPDLRSVDAMSTHGLRKCDTSKCPNLVRLSVDNTNVESVDLTYNYQLRILNVSDTRVTKLDLSHTPNLQQLYATHWAAMNFDYKITEVTLNRNSELIYIFLTGNAIETLDCSGLTKLRDLYVAHNNLTSINIDGCNSLVNVNISDNLLDFNTLPINPGTWSEYFGDQRPFAMPRAVAVGDVIDLKSKVYREDSQTFVTVYSVSRENPSEQKEVSMSKWSYSNGEVVFNSAISDSVYIEFMCPAVFPGVILTTERFKVKDASEFGQPYFAFSFTPIYAGAGEQITFGVGIDGASPANPKRVHVDFGDGDLKVFNVTACNGQMTTISAIKPSYGPIKVYAEGEDVVTDLQVENLYCSDVDVSRLDELRHLTLRNLELYDIDLKWNRCLQSLVLTGNHFYRGIDLTGANGWYGKNVLTHLDLSNNELKEFGMQDVSMYKYLDLSHNQIDSFNFTDAEALEYADLSYNQITDLVLNYCSSLKEGHFDHNQIKSVRMPEENVLEKFSIADNKLTLATLPEHGPIQESHYIYAPQAVIEIPTKGPGHNLSDQYRVINGQATVFTWKTTTGETLVEGVDYTIDKGVTNFLDPTVGKNLYCEISHPAFPAFSGANVLKTTVITSAGVPTNVLATFVTPVGGQSVRLSMTALRNATPIYIDWGTGELTQYILSNESYTLFDATTVAGAEVKVYSYSNVSNLSVFSMTGATLSSIDASGMKQVTAFSINDAKLSEENIVYPRVSGLRELSLTGNNFKTFDASPFTNLEALSLDGNQIKEFDCSKASRKLQTLTISNNGLEKVTFENNNNLWGVALSGNKLQEVDFHGVPSLYQVFLNENELDHIDLSYLNELRVVYLSHNRFDFSNLPIRMPNWTVYVYGNQPQIEIEDGSVVDLSYLAQREGVETIYTWFIDEPDYDASTGELSGEVLVPGDDYTIENGVTKFLKSYDRTSCVMTNSLFPSTYLQTNVIQAETSGVESVSSNGGQMEVKVNGRNVYVNSLGADGIVRLVSVDGHIATWTMSNNGSAKLEAPTAGMYVVTTANGSAKVILK